MRTFFWGGLTIWSLIFGFLSIFLLLFFKLFYFKKNLGILSTWFKCIYILFLGFTIWSLISFLFLTWYGFSFFKICQTILFRGGGNNDHCPIPPIPSKHFCGGGVYYFTNYLKGKKIKHIIFSFYLERIF